MQYKQYSVVKLIDIKKKISTADLSLGNRIPKVGDKAAIVDVYEKPVLGYELECVNQDGSTEWMTTFLSDEVVLELLYEHT